MLKVTSKLRTMKVATYQGNYSTALANFPHNTRSTLIGTSMQLCRVTKYLVGDQAICTTASPNYLLGEDNND